MQIRFKALLPFLLAAASCFAAPVAVTFDTSVLGSGTYYLDFQLIGGEGALGNANNTVTIESLSIAGGSFDGLPQLDGGATGNAATGIQLIDSDFSSGFNGALQAFTPGGILRFVLSYSLNYTGSGAPDQFSFAILDSFLASIVDGGNGALLSVDLKSSATPVLLPAHADFQNQTVTLQQIPEPSTFLLVLPLAAAALLRRRSS